MTRKAYNHPSYGTVISSDGKIRTSWLITLCRAKANQVMMMKRRGYDIEEEEEEWVEASTNDSKLVEMVKKMHKVVSDKSIQVSFGAKFNKTYKIRYESLSKQFTGEVYPFITSDDDIPSQIGQFRMEDGKLVKIKDQEDIIAVSEMVTQVIWGNIPSVDEYGKIDVSTIHQIPSKIFIETGDESVFKSDLRNLYRMRLNVEIFHVNGFVYDPFQNWLVPKQTILNDVEKLLLLCPYYVDGNGDARVNCLFMDTQLPTIPMNDVAMMNIGAMPGNIIHWENESYLATLDNIESGYMLVTGNVSDISKSAGISKDDNEDDGDDERMDMDEMNENEDDGYDNDDGDIDDEN